MVRYLAGLCPFVLKCRQPRGNVDLYLDDEAVQADYGTALGYSKHGCGSFTPAPLARLKVRLRRAPINSWWAEIATWSCTIRTDGWLSTPVTGSTIREVIASRYSGETVNF